MAGIEAWQGGQLAHRGRVTNTLRSAYLFWNNETGTGTSRLLDTEEFTIRPVRLRADARRSLGVRPDVPQGPYRFAWGAQRL